eukprot:s3330_g3.t1
MIELHSKLQDLRFLNQSTYSYAHDARRALLFGTFGATMGGPAYLFYAHVPAKLSRVVVGKWRMVAAMIAVDWAVFMPLIYLPVFYTFREAVYSRPASCGALATGAYAFWAQHVRSDLAAATPLLVTSDVASRARSGALGIGGDVHSIAGHLARALSVLHRTAVGHLHLLETRLFGVIENGSKFCCTSTFQRAAWTTSADGGSFEVSRERRAGTAAGFTSERVPESLRQFAMVYYLLVVAPSSAPTSCASSGVYERRRGSRTSPRAEAEEETVLDVLEVKGLKIFRAIGAGAGLEDALPIQRTSALLLVAIPSELSLDDLCHFLGHREGLEAVRVVFRNEPRGRFFCPSLEGKSDPGSGASGFYTAILLCRSQAHADALYKANHGKLFSHKDSSQDDKGPCCYLAFLEAIVYSSTSWELTRSKSDELQKSSPSDSEIPEAVIPSTAYEVPSCPVCIERIDVSGTGLVTHSHGWSAEHQDSGRPPTCVACAIINATNGGAVQRKNVAGNPVTLQCECCSKQDELWVCLICGHLGCGRYQDAHAKDHATEYRHRFCYQLDTGRIWDYASDVFVHRRLVQHAAMGRFELALPAPAMEESSGSKVPIPGHEQLLSMELDAILASQLDHQRSLYERQLALAAITTVAQARAWAGLAEEPWNALSASLGTVPTLQVLAYIPIYGFKEAIEDARVPVPAQGVPGEEGHVPATTRQLTLVEGTQAGLMLQLARRKFDREVVDPLAASATPATPGSQGVPGTAVPGTGGQNQSQHRKIKNSQVIDQADEGEIPTLDHATLDEHYKVLREAKGGPVRPETEPSADQIAAMKARVLEMDLSPYADFAVFVNFQGRFSKALKFLNHVLQPDGTFKAVEVSGPPNFDAWTLSWKVYVNTLLTLEVVVGTKKVSIASLSAMEEYHAMFRDLVKNYPEAWHLLVIAEDRCRGEHFPRVRRELEAQHDRGLAPNFEPKKQLPTSPMTNRPDARVEQPPHPGQGQEKGGSPTEPGGAADRTLLEVFAGFGGLTQAVRDLGLPVKEPQDTRFGHDIASDEGFLTVLEVRADWKHMAPPCRTFTKARRHDAHGKTKRLRSEGHPEGFGDPSAEEANLLARCAAIAEEQDEREDFFSIENPLDSFIWDLKSMKRLARRKGVQLTPLDQCAYGGPHQKETGVLHNTTWLAQGLRCGDAPPHQHTKLEGRVWSYKEDKEVWDTSAGEEPEEGGHIGGMRNPRQAIRLSPTWQAWREAANRALDEVARTTPGFDQLARSLGAEMTREQADSAQARPMVRFIADMRRSGVNGMTFAEERIVLPRGTDFTKDILDLLELDQAEVELYTADFTDAFLNVPMIPRATVCSGPGAPTNWLHIPGIALHKAAERIGKLTETVGKALAHRGLVPGVRSLAGLVPGVRSLAGELSWIAGLVPTIRPFVNMVWAALYGMDTQRNKATTGQSSARARPVGTVFAKTIRVAIWNGYPAQQSHHRPVISSGPACGHGIRQNHPSAYDLDEKVSLGPARRPPAMGG